MKRHQVLEKLQERHSMAWFCSALVLRALSLNENVRRVRSKLFYVDRKEVVSKVGLEGSRTANDGSRKCTEIGDFRM